MYPHERSLVARMRKQPFVLIGVNSDADLAALKPVLSAEGITWRSFWDGPLHERGRISPYWDVSSWPTLFLIDHKGILRKRWSLPPTPEELDREVDQWVAKAKRR